MPLIMRCGVGAIKLSAGLANCGECFEILDLSLNNVESAGVIAIATGLEGCKVLKVSA